MPFSKSKFAYNPEELYDPKLVTAVQIGGNIIRVQLGTYEEQTFPGPKSEPIEIFKFIDRDSPTSDREEVTGKTETIEAMWQRLPAV